MNTLQIKGNWNLVKGKLKKQFGSLTDNDLLYVEGREDELLGRLQQALGKTREEILDLINSTTSTDDNTAEDNRDFEDSEDAREERNSGRGRR